MVENDQPVILTEEQLKEKAANELAPVQALEQKVNTLELALAENPQFVEFMKFTKEAADKKAKVLKELEKEMIASQVKSIKLDEFGTLTIVDGKNWKYDENELPKKFFKKVVDTTAVNNQFKLTGTPPKGASYEPKQYIKVTPKKDKK
jgi:hypothetical protein